MKRKQFFRISVLILALTIALCVPVHAEKYMDCDLADFEITLDDCGDAQITESWDCSFSGGITRYRKLCLLPENGYSIEIQDISIDGESTEMLDEPDDSRPTGYSAVYYDSEGLRLEMYLDGEDGSHTVDITYHVTDAVILHDDVAEFRWNLSTGKEAFPIRTLNAHIEIPYGTEDHGLYFWAHGPEENASFDALTEDGMVNEFELYMEEISPEQPVMVRFAMPLELFPYGSRFESGDALEDIRWEENDNSEVRGQDDPVDVPDSYGRSTIFELILAFFRTVLAAISIGLCAVPAICLFFLSGLLKKIAQKRYLPKQYAKNRHKPAENPQYYRGLPDHLKPAMVYKLTTIYPIKGEGLEILQKGDAFSATVLDLIESGHLRTVTTITGEIAYQVIPCSTPLTEYEKSVLELYTTAGADQAPVSTEALTTYMRDNYAWCKRIYREFHQNVEDAFENSELYVKFPHADWDRKRILTAGGITAAAIFVGLWPLTGFMPAVVLGLFLGMLDGVIYNGIDEDLHPDFSILTQNGENHYALWMAYARFLDDFTTFSERQVEDVKVWRKYLVYATALGRSEKVMESLKLTMPQVYDSFVQDFYPAGYEETFRSVSAIHEECGYTIRSSSSSDGWSSGGDDGWGDCSDSGGSCDSGSGGSDFD